MYGSMDHKALKSIVEEYEYRKLLYALVCT